MVLLVIIAALESALAILLIEIGFRTCIHIYLAFLNTKNNIRIISRIFHFNTLARDV